MKEVKARPGVKYSDEYFDQIINGQDASSQLYLCFDSSDNLLAGAVGFYLDPIMLIIISLLVKKVAGTFLQMML